MKIIIILLLAWAASLADTTATDSPPPESDTQASAEIDTVQSVSQPSVETPVDYSTKSGLGFTGGPTTGIGFAYRKHFPFRMGIHAGGFFLAGSDEGDEDEDEEGNPEEPHSWIWANVGAEFLYTIHRHKEKYFRFYVLAGCEVIIEGEDYEKKEWKYDKTYIVGAGLGIEFLIREHVGIALELPFSVQIHEDGFDMLPFPNVSLVYFL